MNRFLILIALFSLLSVSCKKRNKKEAFSGTITAITPTEGDTIFGNSQQINAVANANDELHGWYYAIYDSATLNVLYENQLDIHGETLTINEAVTFSQTDTTTLKIVYEFATDDAGNNLTKTIYCTLIP